MIMIIDCIADLHGYFPKLDGGDLLIVAGDLTSRDEAEEYMAFHQWIRKQKYKKVILVSGNHDNKIQQGFFSGKSISNEWLGFEYLCNSGTEFEGLKIWGTPHSLIFDGVNPHCTAFMKTEEELDVIYSNIPNDINVLISHTPPYGILDKNFFGEWCGSESLRNAMYRTKPKYLVCGHIHECGGKEVDLVMTKVINCSYVNEKYQPVNKPVRMIYNG